MTYYKFLLPGRITPVQKSVWPVRVGAWTPKAKPILCESGWHASEAKDLIGHMPSTNNVELWEVEGKGEMVEGDDKVAFEQMKLVRLVRTFDARNLRLYACAVAEDVLPMFEKRYPDDSRPREAIEVSRRFANGEVTQEELDASLAASLAAARAAAGAAARAASWDAARAASWAASWAATRAAAGAAARAASWDATRAAAWAAAGAASWAAARAAAWAKYSEWLVDGWTALEKEQG